MRKHTNKSFWPSGKINAVKICATAMDWEIQISLCSTRDERRGDLSRNGWNSGGHLEGQKRGTNVPQIAPQLTRFVSVQGFPKNCAILRAEKSHKPSQGAFTAEIPPSGNSERCYQLLFLLFTGTLHLWDVKWGLANGCILVFRLYGSEQKEFTDWSL